MTPERRRLNMRPTDEGKIILTPVTRKCVDSLFGKCRGRDLLGALAKEKKLEKKR